MAGAGFGWTALFPSRERRLWLLAAAALCILCAVALGFAAWTEPTSARLLALVAAVTAALIALRAAYRAPVPVEVRVDADGIIWQRPLTSADAALPAAVRLHPRVVASRLCCLSDSNGRASAVWHDALPAERFRALCAHARWHVERTRDDAPAGLA